MNEKFVITSDNCGKYKDTLFGYMITNDMLYTSWSDEIEMSGKYKDAKGAFVAIFHEDNILHICRDRLGLIRIYCFQKDNYWAISNSFWSLCELLIDKIAIKLGQL